MVRARAPLLRMIHPYKNQAIANLKKVNGQIAHLLAMIEEGKYCIDIAQQINAAIGLLRRTNQYVLESHLFTCSRKKLAKGGKRATKLFAEEILRACDMTNR